MNFFAVFLQKLEPSCEIQAYSAAIYRKVLCRKWAPLVLFFVTVSCIIRGYHVYKEVWNLSIREVFVCFAEEENSHDRKAVISTSDDISKGNIASKPSSGANAIFRHCSRGVYSH